MKESDHQPELTVKKPIGKLKNKQNAPFKAWEFEMNYPEIIQEEEDIFKRYGFEGLDNKDIVYSTGKTIFYRLSSNSIGPNLKTDNQSAPLIVLKLVRAHLCSSRYRENLINVSTRIQKFIGSKNALMSIHFPKFYQVFILNDPIKYYALMEYVPGKTLHSKVTNKEPISPLDIKLWTRQIASAVNILHSFAISHRSLRLEHVLLNNQGICKIVGWNKSVIFWDFDKREYRLQKRETRCRRNNHLPHEVFRYSQYNPRYIDVWSFGVILCGLLTNKYPINCRSHLDFGQQVKLFYLKHNLAEEEVTFLNKIFKLNPRKRITFEQIIEDEFLQIKKEQSTSKSKQAKQFVVKLETIQNVAKIYDIFHTKVIVPKNLKKSNGEPIKSVLLAENNLTFENSSIHEDSILKDYFSMDELLQNPNVKFDQQSQPIAPNATQKIDWNQTGTACEKLEIDDDDLDLQYKSKSNKR